MLIDWHNLRLIVSSYFVFDHKHVLSLLAAVYSTDHISRRTPKNVPGVGWSTYSVAPDVIFRFDDFFYKLCSAFHWQANLKHKLVQVLYWHKPKSLYYTSAAQISMYTKFVCVCSGEVLSAWFPFGMNKVVSDSMASVGRERLRWTLCWEIHPAGSSLPNNARTMMTV